MEKEYNYIADKQLVLLKNRLQKIVLCEKRTIINCLYF